MTDDTSTQTNDAQEVLARTVERDICLLYYQLINGMPGEMMDFSVIFVLPYWEYLDLQGIGVERREFIRDGSLVMIKEMACEAKERGGTLLENMMLCRAAVEKLDPPDDRVAELAKIVLSFVAAAEQRSTLVTESMQEDSSYVQEEYVKRYFRDEARTARASLHFEKNGIPVSGRALADWYIRDAQTGYERMYRATSGEDAQAAYRDCTESLTAAIGYARKTGREDRVPELQKLIEHYRAVRNRMFG